MAKARSLGVACLVNRLKGLPQVMERVIPRRSAREEDSLVKAATAPATIKNWAKFIEKEFKEHLLNCPS
jgi:hypothetical protein